MKTGIIRIALSVSVLIAFCGCRHDEYDISDGIDTEITLFADEVSLPVGDIGPLTPRVLLDNAGVGGMLKSFVQEDSDGYLILEQSEPFYTNWVMMLSMLSTDPSQPMDIPVDAYSAAPSSSSSTLSQMGFSLSPQVITLTADNPLTEEIAVSGKIVVSSNAEGDEAPATLASREFARAKVAAEAAQATVVSLEITGGKDIGSCRVEDVVLHLPASIMEKDSKSGMGAFSLSYNYKGYLSVVDGFPASLPFSIDKLDLPLAQYRVKEARIQAEVSSEIPITLELESVDVLVKNADDMLVPCEDVTVTPGIRIGSGRTGEPAVTPIDVRIQALNGTIPDINGFRLAVRILGPTTEGDNRLGLNQSIYVRNLRATVSGGITIQGL